jgi:hypothetical protein
MGLTDFYKSAKGKMGGIDAKEATQLVEDWAIAGGTGAIIGLIASSAGGLDHTVAGMKVPVDGILSVGLGIASLTMQSQELRVASIAAAGSASARTFQGIFSKGLGAHGDSESPQLGFGHNHAPQQLEAGYGFGDALSPQSQFGSSFGFGSDRDRLVEAAKSL